MKDPTPLAADDPGFARLMRALHTEEPPPDALERALAVVDRAPLLPSPTSAPRGVMASKVVGTLVAGGLVVAAVATFWPAPTAPAPRPAPAPSAVSVVVPVVSAELPAIPVEALPSSIETRAPVASPPARTITPSPSAEVAAERRPTFAEELALVVEARAALARSDTTQCLTAVDRYTHDYPSGAFAPEIDVLRIEAVARSGDRARARILADRFSSANPSSPYADRVRSVLRGSGE